MTYHRELMRLECRQMEEENMGARTIWFGKQVLIMTFFQFLLFSSNALPADTPAPASVTIAGSFQSELGCPGDWQPDCATTHLSFDTNDQAWQGTFNIPSGSWEYKAALNDSWDENYGQNATRSGASIGLNLPAASAVKFYYSHETHWITDNHNSVIAVATGSFQSELGCPGDWQPDCLRSWLQDPDGDGIYTFTTRGLPAGNYEVKVAINESWDENYGAGGALNGANIPFTVPSICGEVLFSYNALTHILTVSAGIDSLVPPSISKAFNPTTIARNAMTALTFTITNPAANPTALTGVAFTDTLPPGIVVSTPNGLTNTCGGTATAVAGSGSVSLSGATIATGSNCTLTVTVTGMASGNFTNTTGAVTSTNGGTGNTATASVTIYVAEAIPTLTDWGITLLMFFLGLGSVSQLKRPRKKDKKNRVRLR
jgi:hypothetical protein